MDLSIEWESFGFRINTLQFVIVVKKSVHKYTPYALCKMPFLDTHFHIVRDINLRYFYRDLESAQPHEPVECFQVVFDCMPVSVPSPLFPLCNLLKRKRIKRRTKKNKQLVEKAPNETKRKPKHIKIHLEKLQTKINNDLPHPANESECTHDGSIFRTRFLFTCCLQFPYKIQSISGFRLMAMENQRKDENQYENSVTYISNNLFLPVVSNCAEWQKWMKKENRWSNKKESIRNNNDPNSWRASQKKNEKHCKHCKLVRSACIDKNTKSSTVGIKICKYYAIEDAVKMRIHWKWHSYLAWLKISKSMLCRVATVKKMTHNEITSVIFSRIFNTWWTTQFIIDNNVSNSNVYENRKKRVYITKSSSRKKEKPPKASFILLIFKFSMVFLLTYIDDDVVFASRIHMHNRTRARAGNKLIWRYNRCIV